MAASLYWWLVNAATDYHCEPHQAVMRVFTARTRDALLLVDDYFPFLAGIFAWTDIPTPRSTSAPSQTIRQLEIHAGQVNKLDADLAAFIQSSATPAFGLYRLCDFCAVTALRIGLIVSYVADFRFFPGWTSVFVGILFSLGIQLGALGVVGEYVGRIFRQTSGRPKYVVREFRARADGDWWTRSVSTPTSIFANSPAKLMETRNSTN